MEISTSIVVFASGMPCKWSREEGEQTLHCKTKNSQFLRSRSDSQPLFKIKPPGSQHLQPHRSGSTVGGGSPRYLTVSLFPFLQTGIAAGEPASSSVSSHSLNHLSSWVLAARSKPLNTVLPFQPKGMAKSQNGQARIVA